MSQPSIRDEQETAKEQIINRLTKQEEDKLRDIHSKHYMGTDDDMPEKFEAWLMRLSLEELTDFLSI